jgi:hypothetical protein
MFVSSTIAPIHIQMLLIPFCFSTPGANKHYLTPHRHPNPSTSIASVLLYSRHRSHHRSSPSRPFCQRLAFIQASAYFHINDEGSVPKVVLSRSANSVLICQIPTFKMLKSRIRLGDVSFSFDQFGSKPPFLTILVFLV